MITKGIYYIVLGFIGIIKNKEFSFKTKCIFIIDYVVLLIKLMKVFLFKTKYVYVKIKAFDITIYFKRFYSFFYIFNEVFCMGVYPATYKLHTYIDAGAYIGISILWFHVFNPKLEIIAFEPNKENLFYLKKNLRVNHVKNVTVYQTCLVDKNGKAPFYLVDDPIQNLDSGLILNRPYLPYSTFEVKTNKLSRFVHKQISLLKMDVEGAEYDILKDLFASKKINLIANIYFEAHYYTNKQINGYKKFSKKLRSIGNLTAYVNTEYSTANYYCRNNLSLILHK